VRARHGARPRDPRQPAGGADGVGGRADLRRLGRPPRPRPAVGL
jgi:hypothetical protein